LDYAGRTLVGKYRVEKLLGQGGMGSVWKGTHTVTGRKIALKILDERFLTNANVVQRFGREARAASSIAHEGIVEVLDLDQTEEGVPFLVMEFLEGESLAHRIDYGDPMTEEEVVRVGALLLDALHAAHESGVVHRDLKPDNIYLIQGRRGDAIKILDFGISWKSDEQDAKLTVTGSVLGTPHYMSPEQAMGDVDTDRRVDIYAAGVVLYECAVGAVPFEGANYNKLLRVILDSNPVPPTERGAKISPPVEAVILKALSKRKDDRPATAAEMREMLLRAARGEAPPRSSPGVRVGGAAKDSSDDAVASRWLDAPLENEPPAREPRSRPEAAVPPAARVEPPRQARSAAGEVRGLDPLSEGPSAHSLEIDERALERKPASTTRASQARMPAVGAATSSAGAVAAPVEAARAPSRDETPTGRQTRPSGVTAPTPVVRASQPEPSSSPVMRWVLVGVLALAAVGVIALGLRTFLARDGTTPPPTTTVSAQPDAGAERPTPTKQPPGAQFVDVTVDVDPAASDMRMRLDGIPGATSPIRVRRGTRHVLEISAPGFIDERVEIRAERDQRVRVTLRPAAR
jgi:serine/threonine-protein kinase